jgi:hypothetical protein
MENNNSKLQQFGQFELPANKQVSVKGGGAPVKSQGSNEIKTKNAAEVKNYNPAPVGPKKK